MANRRRTSGTAIRQQLSNSKPALGRQNATLVGEEEPPCVFTFEDSDDEPATATHDKSKAIQPLPPHKPAEPAVADALLLQQRIAALQAGLQAMQARKAKAARLGAAAAAGNGGSAAMQATAAAKPRAKPLRSAAGSTITRSGGATPPPPATGEVSPATGEAAAAAAGTPEVSPEELMEDLHFILGEQQTAEEAELLHMLQAEVAAQSSAPGSPARQHQQTPALAALDEVPNATAAPAAPVLPPSKPVAVKRKAVTLRANSAEPRQVPNQAAATAAPTSGAAARPTAAANRSPASARASQKSSPSSKQNAPAAAGVAIQTAPKVKARLQLNSTSGSPSSAIATAAKAPKKGVVKAKPKAAAAAALQQQQAMQDILPAGAHQEALQQQDATVLDGMQAVHDRELLQQQQLLLSPQVLSKSEQQRRQMPLQREQRPPPPSPQQQQQQPGQQLHEPNLPKQHQLRHWQNGQQQCLQLVQQQQSALPQLQQHVLPLGNTTLLSTLLSPHMPSSMSHLGQQQQQQVLLLLAQQQRCLIQERLLQQEVAQLQASWSDINRQLQQLLGPEAGVQQAAEAAAAAGVLLTQANTAVTTDAAGHTRGLFPAAATAAVPAAADAAAAAAPVATAAVAADEVADAAARSSHLDARRQQYEQQRLQLQAPAKNAGSAAGLQLDITTSFAHLDKQQQQQPAVASAAPAAHTAVPDVGKAATEQAAAAQPGSPAHAGKKRQAEQQQQPAENDDAKRPRLVEGCAALKQQPAAKEAAAASNSGPAPGSGRVRDRSRGRSDERDRRRDTQTRRGRSRSPYNSRLRRGALKRSVTSSSVSGSSSSSESRSRSRGRSVPRGRDSSRYHSSYERQRYYWRSGLGRSRTSRSRSRSLSRSMSRSRVRGYGHKGHRERNYSRSKSRSRRRSSSRDRHGKQARASSRERRSSTERMAAAGKADNQPKAVKEQANHHRQQQEQINGKGMLVDKPAVVDSSKAEAAAAQSNAGAATGATAVASKAARASQLPVSSPSQQQAADAALVIAAGPADIAAAGSAGPAHLQEQPAKYIPPAKRQSMAAAAAAAAVEASASAAVAPPLPPAAAEQGVVSPPVWTSSLDARRERLKAREQQQQQQQQEQPSLHTVPESDVPPPPPPPLPDGPPPPLREGTESAAMEPTAVAAQPGGFMQAEDGRPAPPPPPAEVAPGVQQSATPMALVGGAADTQQPAGEAPAATRAVGSVTSHGSVQQLEGARQASPLPADVPPQRAESAPQPPAIAATKARAAGVISGQPSSALAGTAAAASPAAVVPPQPGQLLLQIEVLPAAREAAKQDAQQLPPPQLPVVLPPVHRKLEAAAAAAAPTARPPASSGDGRERSVQQLPVLPSAPAPAQQAAALPANQAKQRQQAQAVAAARAQVSQGARQASAASVNPALVQHPQPQATPAAPASVAMPAAAAARQSTAAGAQQTAKPVQRQQQTGKQQDEGTNLGWLHTRSSVQAPGSAMDAAVAAAASSTGLTQPLHQLLHIMLQGARQIHTARSHSSSSSSTGLVSAAADAPPPVSSSTSSAEIASSIAAAFAAALSGKQASAPGSGTSLQQQQAASNNKQPASSRFQPYQTPLMCFSSYRLAQQFPGTCVGVNPGCPTFCHCIDPQWPLCRHDARGVHRDAACAWQHWSDMSLSVNETEQQLQQLLRSAGVPQAAVAAATTAWKGEHLLQQTQQGQLAGSAPAAGANQQQSSSSKATRHVLDAVAAAGVDWGRIVLQAAAGKPPAVHSRKPKRRVDAFAKAAAVDSGTPAAMVSLQQQGRMANHSSSNWGRSGESRVLKQQPSLLAAAGIVSGHQQSSNANGQQLFPCDHQLYVVDRPLPGIDMYALPADQQQEQQLVAWQQSKQQQWLQAGRMAADAAADALRQQHQRSKGWRYFSETLFTSHLAAAEQDVAGAAGGAAAATAAPEEVAAAVLSALSNIDAQFQARQQQEQHVPEFWVSWALAVLDVLKQPFPAEAAAASSQPPQQQQQQARSAMKRADILNRAGSILLKGFSMHASRPQLWLLHVQLLLRRAGFGLMQATVLQRVEGFCPNCYQLYLLSGHVQATWQQQAIIWLKAIAALSASSQPSSSTATTSQPSSVLAAAANNAGTSDQAGSSNLAACVLDLALRLVRCLCAAGAQEVFVLWCEQLITADAAQCSLPTPAAVKAAAAKVNTSVQALLKELDRIAKQPQSQQPTQPGKVGAAAAAAGSAAGSAAAQASVAACNAVLHDILAASSLGTLAVHGLLALLSQHPVEAAIFWLSLVHAAACGCLPSAVEARLHYKQELLVLDAREFGLQSGAAEGVESQGLLLAGRLLCTAAGSWGGFMLERTAVAAATAAIEVAAPVQQQQQHLAAQAISSSMLALQPYWLQMGIAQFCKEQLPAVMQQYMIVPPGQLQQQQSTSDGTSQGGTSSSSRGATATAVLDSLLQLVDAAGAAAVHSDDLVAVLLQHMPRLIGVNGVISTSAARSSNMSPTSAQPVGNSCSNGLTGLLSSHAAKMSELAHLPGMLQQQHIWAAAAAAVSVTSQSSASVHATASTAQQGQQLLSFLLGAASGVMLCQPVDTDAVAAVPRSQHVLSLPQPVAVRAAYMALLSSGTAPRPQAQTTQQQQQNISSLSPLAVEEGQSVSAAVMLQRCLAYINWCGYEVCLGEWSKAGQCLLAAMQEAVQLQQPILLQLLQRQVLELLAGLMHAQSETEAVPAAQAVPEVASWTATEQAHGQHTAAAALVRSLLHVLQLSVVRQKSAGHAATSSTAGAGQAAGRRDDECLVALQHPQLQFSDDSVSQRLQPPLLQVHSPMLDSGLEELLAGLSRKQVVLLVEQLVSSCPPSPRLLRLLLHQASRYANDAGWASWLLPLLINTCCACEPPASALQWAAVVELAHGISASAAVQLAEDAVRAHPWSLQLWQLHHDTMAAPGRKAAVMALAARHGLALRAQ